MPGDLRKISLLAVVLLVLLRISIGWHLMYEGLWKLSTQHTSTPWTSVGYLKNATGPFRPMFRAMTGDPDDLLWLDSEHMTQKWNAWREQFVNHYGLDDTQKNRLDRLMTGTTSYAVALDALPSGLDLADVDGVHKKAIRFDAKAKRLIVDGKLHLLPVERDRLIAAAKDLAVAKPDEKDACDQFIASVEKAYDTSSRLSYTEQLAALLKGDPERVGVIIQAKSSAKSGDEEAAAEKDDKGGAQQLPVVVQVGEVEYYKELIDRFKKNYARARTTFEWDHIDKQWKDLQDLRSKLVGPVQALEKKLQAAAEELLSPEQLAAGPVPEPWTPVRKIDWRTMWGLTVFGLLLLVGLFSRLSALGAAALLTLFYLAMPPWPGVKEFPSIEHNLFVNKVFVEMLALLVLAAMPTGKWFGLDAAVSVLFIRRPKEDKKKK